MVARNLSSTRFLVLIWALTLNFCVFAGGVNAFQMKLTSDHLILKNGRESLAVSLSATLAVDNSMVIVKAFSVDTKLNPLSGRMLELPCAPTTMANGNKIEPTILLQWSPKESVLRKWVRLKLLGDSSVLLKEVTLEDTPAPNPTPDSPVQPSTGSVHTFGESDLQSQPVFIDSFFAGIEFPIGCARYVNNRIILMHKPGVRLKPGDTYESKKAVYGIAPKGKERLVFEKYIAANRPKSAKIHFNYNSWWTTPVPYSEADVLKLLQTFKDKLVDPHGVSIDTFCIDLGWSRKDGLWEIDEKTFPQGFANIRDAAKAMGSHLGLWISPSNWYSPSSMDNNWVAQQGYETFEAPGWDRKPMLFPCLAGVKYSTKFAERLVDMGKRWEIKHFKFDGYRFTCPQADHGHEPGELSAEAVASGIISAYSALRKAVPDVWMQATCYGWDPSPWWVFHVNSVIGTFGDDAPHGCVPCPVYRESYTSARDYFNLQGAARLPIPIAAQEVLGIVHQTTEPFTNDAVTTILRGHSFVSLYLNPAYMNDERWATLASIIKWARTNADVLSSTQPLLPESWLGGKVPKFTAVEKMPREPYGYAHWKNDKGLVLLRNPWVKKASYRLKIDDECFRKLGSKRLSVVSLYPEPRLYAESVRPGDVLEVWLAPYETVVLSIDSKQPTDGLIDARQVLAGSIELCQTRYEAKRVELDGSSSSLASQLIEKMKDTKSAIDFRLSSDLKIIAPKAELLILIEHDGNAPPYALSLEVNGAETTFSTSGSDTGWGASWMSRIDNWVFLRVPMSPGKNTVDAKLLIGTNFKSLSAWVWATKDKPSVVVDYPNSLPSPELISLDSCVVFPAITPGDVPVLGQN